MFSGDVIGGDGGAVDVEYSAVGIQPGVEFHAAFVCFLDHELKRIIERNGWLSLFAGEEFTPGFERRRIESIGNGTYLYDQGVHAVSFVQFGQADEVSFLFFGMVGAVLWPVDITDCGDPYTSEFRSGLCLRGDGDK